MSLARKDIRAKLDDDMHEALEVLCAVDQITIGEFVEREVLRAIRQRMKDAELIAKRAPHLLGLPPR